MLGRESRGELTQLSISKKKTGRESAMAVIDEISITTYIYERVFSMIDGPCVCVHPRRESETNPSIWDREGIAFSDLRAELRSRGNQMRVARDVFPRMCMF
jgi:hypothetical protein